MKLYVLPSYLAVQTVKYVKIHDSDGLYVPYFRFWTLLEIRFSVVCTWGFWSNVANKIEIMRRIHMLIVNLISTTLTKEIHPWPRHPVCPLHFHILTHANAYLLFVQQIVYCLYYGTLSGTFSLFFELWGMVKGSKKKGRDPFKKAPGEAVQGRQVEEAAEVADREGAGVVAREPGQLPPSQGVLWNLSCAVSSRGDSQLDLCFGHQKHLHIRCSWVGQSGVVLANQLDSDDLRCCHYV